MNKKRIGIIGGLGAMAGARFYTTLVKMCQEMGAEKDSDFPETILYSVSTDAMNNEGILYGVKLEEMLIRKIHQLRDDFKCDKILIACNTAYVYFDNFRHLFHDLVVSLPESAIKRCGSKQYGVVCSRTTRDKKLYGSALYCDDDQQSDADEIIQRIMKGTTNDDDRSCIAEIVQFMFRAGCVNVIFGCTELPVLLLPDHPNIIDPARTAIAEALA